MIERKKKVLIVSYKNYYINLTDDAIYAALSKNFELTFFGPGYQSFAVLKKGLAEFVDKQGPFELAILHQYVHQSLYRSVKPDPKGTSYQKFYFDRIRFHEELPRFGKGFFALTCPKVLMSLRTDTYAFNQVELERYSEFPGYLLITPPQLITPIQEKQAQLQEFSQVEGNDYFLMLGRRCKSKIIPIPHTVFDKEVVRSDFDARKFSVSVPGAPYQDRVRAIALLREQGIRTIDQSLCQRILMKANSLLKGRLSTSSLYIKIFQHEFRKILKNSQCVFTDGSRSRSPVRKFFEIPAAGAVLMSDMFRNCEELGFVKDHNYFFVTVDELIDFTHTKFCQDLAYLQQVATNGARMIAEKHSVTARAHQLKQVITQICNDTYQGSIWHKGSLISLANKVPV